TTAMISAVTTTNAIALRIAIAQALSAFCAEDRSPVAARTMTANNGRNRRLNSLTIPYRAMPEVAGILGTPQPRMTTHRTPMFQGPNGTLEPMPDRISQDVGPRMIETPGMRAQKTRPLTNQAIAPRIVMIAIWLSVSAWNAAATSW